MGWPQVLITEDGRCRLAKASGILNFIGFLPCIIVLIVGIYIQVRLQEKVHLIEGLDSSILPIFMITVGAIGAIVSILGGKICWSNQYPHKRDIWRKYLLPYAIILLIIFLGIFVAGIVCFVHINLLHHSFGRGIKNAMHKYKSDSFKKHIVDKLQIEFSCCGSNSYTDWFNTPWVNRDRLGSKKKKKLRKTGNVGENYINDDTPYSCCRMDVLRPCIHHHVHDNDRHYNYDYKTGVTVHTRGCNHALMAFYGDMLLTDVGALVLAISGLELIIVILTRLLQTSIDKAEEQGDPEEPSHGHILPFGKRAVQSVKQGIKKYHKGEGNEDVDEVPLLEEYGTEEELGQQINEENVDDVTDAGSFVSDFDSDKAADAYEIPQENQNNYYEINSKEVLSRPPSFQAPPPPMADPAIMPDHPRYSAFPTNQSFAAPPPPPPPGEYVIPDYDTVDNYQQPPYDPIYVNQYDPNFANQYDPNDPTYVNQ